MTRFPCTISCLLLPLLFCLLLCTDLLGITPNPLISRGRPVYGPQNAPGNLVNGTYGETAWNAAAGAWVAINVGAGPTRISLTWNCTNYMWSDRIASPNCPQNIPVPTSYDLLVSANSTNGTDGTWTKKLSITENIVAARSHLVDFNGSSWIKMSVSGGSGWIDEIEVFDASVGNEDTWFFAGTSITANAFKGPVPPESVADLATKAHPGFTPAVIRGGIGCINSTAFLRDISKYFEHGGPVGYFCIEMGTNDGWGGSNANAVAFKTNLQRVIDSCKRHGIQPILARTIATDSSTAKWQIHPDFIKAIDDLTTANNLIHGPDLYTWFKSHPAEFTSDGVHPNARGGQSIVRLWAETIGKVYGTSKGTFYFSFRNAPPSKKTLHRGGLPIIFLARDRTPPAGTIIDVLGRTVTRIAPSFHPENAPDRRTLSPGMYCIPHGQGSAPFRDTGDK